MAACGSPSSMLFSVIFRSTATSALCALGLWLFFFIAVADDRARRSPSGFAPPA